jgi:hypothetical protein
VLTDANKPATSKTTAKSSRVFAPCLLIEISGGGETRFVVDPRINARYEWLSGFVTTRQAPANYVILDGQKAAMLAVCAPDSRFRGGAGRQPRPLTYSATDL